MKIEIGKTYNCFHDGKIRESRRRSVIITDIIHFDKINEETLLLWKEEVKDCHWLYAKETDYFVFGELKDVEENDEAVIFVRTTNNGWFSLGFWAGRLDIDGKLRETLN